MLQSGSPPGGAGWRQQWAKQLALWRAALVFGFVFAVAEFTPLMVAVMSQHASVDVVPFEVSPADYQSFRSRRFGQSNPDEMGNPFWNEMVRLEPSR